MNKNKVALVTGAKGGGIGTTIVNKFASTGIKTYSNGRTSNTNIPFTNADNIFHADGDITDLDLMKSVADKILTESGKIDIMVHNAAPGFPFESCYELSSEMWKKEFDIILNSAFELCKLFVPSMIENKFGRLIFISSSTVYKGSQGRSIGYVSAKAALHGMVKQLALELGQFNITANVIAPSQIDTPRIRKGGRRTTAYLNKYAESIPMRRVGVPEDIANTVSFLASEDSSYITGQAIRVDGGSSLSSKSTQTNR